MPLKDCPDCGNQVSTSAAACPKCGAPVGSPEIATPLVTVQLTSKSLKQNQIYSTLITFVGLCLFIIAVVFLKGYLSSIVGYGGLIIFLSGAIWVGVTKFRIWWHHR